MFKNLRFIFLSLIFVLLVSSCSLNYDIADYGNIIIGYSKFENNAFVGCINFDINNDNPNIVIEDNYKGIPITELGGYFGRGVPTPFCVLAEIETPDVNRNFTTNYDSDFIYSDNVQIHEYYVNIYLPLTLKSVTYTIKDVVCSSYENNDGEEITDIYIVRCNIQIDDSNKYFYSIDSKLYDKNTNTLVDKFIY